MTRRDFIFKATAGICAAMAAPLILRADAWQQSTADISDLRRKVEGILDSTAYNRIPGTDTKIYDSPLFGVSSAQDPLYRKLKEAVGPDHYMPEDFLPEASAVISFFLPYSEAVRKANYGPEDSPSIWLLAHKKGAATAELVRRFVVRKLNSMNAKSLVPYHDSRYLCNRNLISNWSERHVAFISGLGTFGLHKSIITEKGSAGRLDSVITDFKFATTRRNYNEVYAYCVKCYSCIGRCPVKAIKETGKSIQVCARKVLAGKNSPHQAVCGKCLTQTPCENCRPQKPG